MTLPVGGRMDDKRSRVIFRHLLLLVGVVPLAMLTLAVALAWALGIR